MPPDRLSGHVEKLEVETPGPGRLDGASFKRIGSALACLLWFGITDLHGANVFFGLDPAGRLVFSPVDIECLFEEVSLPSQSHLMPAGRPPLRSGGLAEVRAFLREHGDPSMIAAMCGGFLEAVSLLERADLELMAAFDESFDLPVRVILRDTRVYSALLAHAEGPASPPLAASERVQLARGDIPYFFRRMSGRDILFYTDGFQPVDAGLPRSKRDRLLALARVPEDGAFRRRRSASELRTFAPLQLARYFDPGGERFDSSFGPVSVEYDGAGIILRQAPGRPLGCKRL